MALEVNNLSTFRRRIGDQVKADNDAALGNGEDRRYYMRYTNIFEVIVRDEGFEVTDSNYTLDSVAGSVTFNSAPADNALLVFDYKYAAYTDEEATALIEQFGLNQAIMEALYGLMADSARLYNYSKGSSSSSKSDVFSHLKDLVKQYSAEFGLNGEGSDIKIGMRVDPQTRPAVEKIDLSRADAI